MGNVAIQIRRMANAAVGRDFFAKVDIERRTIRYGSAYGGWQFSGVGLSRNSTIYCAGLSDDISFELALIHGYGATVHAFDTPVRSIESADRRRLPREFIVHPYGLAERDDVATGGRSESETSLACKRVASIMVELGHDRIDVLKLDIGGAEYGVIADLEKSDIYPGQVLVKFHHRFKKIGIQKSREAIDRLRGIGYALYAVSDSGVEYSFSLQKKMLRR